jgi:hypothetical protein
MKRKAPVGKKLDVLTERRVGYIALACYGFPPSAIAEVYGGNYGSIKVILSRLRRYYKGIPYFKSGFAPGSKPQPTASNEDREPG